MIEHFALKTTAKSTRLSEHGVGHLPYSIVIDRFDIAIVGGGPAGAFAALRLSLRGASVILIDRRSEGEGKTCGHCLNSRCLPLLSQTGVLNKIKHLSMARTKAATIHLSDTVHIRSRITSSRCGSGLIIRRDQFDHALLDAAACVGATIVRSARASILGRVDDRTIELQVHANDRTHESMRIRTPLIIGADGIGSSVASSFSLVDPQLRRSRSIGFSFDVYPDDLSHLSRESVEMFVHPLGYMGIVRESGPDRAHVGGYIRGHRTPRPDVLTFVHKITQQFQLLQRTFGDHISRNALNNLQACGPMPFRPHLICAPNVALIGDAAGYVEPFTGEGMSCAIENADLLSRVLTRFDLQWSCAARREYAACWKRQIRVIHDRCRLTGAMIRYAIPLVRCGPFEPLLHAATNLMAARIATPRYGTSWACEDRC